MIYPADFEQRIGFDQLRNLVAAGCVTDAARGLALGNREEGEIAEEGGIAEDQGLGFSSDFEWVSRQLRQAYEMRAVLTTETDYPGGSQGGYVDIGRFLRKVRVAGTYPDLSELGELQKGLILVEGLTGFFRGRHGAEGERGQGPYPLLYALAEPVAGFAPILKEISRLLDPFGQMRDSASPELAELRRALSHKSAQIDKRLQAILRQAQAAGLVDAEAEISVRDGRGVIPVAAGNKRKIKGLVLGESASGRTAFVEPMEVVELGNQVRELQAAEKREVIRILIAFADGFVRPRVEELLAAGEYLVGMDFIEAKARYALSIDATLPALEPEPVVELRQARHPLLQAALAREGKAIVPLDLFLSRERHILLISGPNAGGKSVCLKTVGLLQYMLQCGLLVPLSEDSRMGLFRSLFIDIGDQQSLDNDLSTYSSHLQNMKTVLRDADDKSLVLIDEFGSGTEPGTGGAIAEAVLQQIEARHVWGVITTHYANLKYYAAGSQGIQNGAMAFDLEHIQPLFRLEQGRPGSSFAFEIARKIGLPEPIIAAAAEKIGSSAANAERHIREAARDKRYWESKRERIRQTQKQIDQTATQYEVQLAEIQADKTKILQQARTEAAQLLTEANRRIEQTIREIREAQAQRERTRELRADFDDFRSSLDPDAPSLDPSPMSSRAQSRDLSTRQPKATKGAAPGSPGSLTPAPLSPGSHVRIRGQHVVGEVLQVQGKRITVAFNQMSTTVDAARLERVSAAEARQLRRAASSFTGVYGKSDAQGYDTSRKRLDFKLQLDLRGMRAAQALEAVREYIDQALMLGVPQVKILHGKGTGALKQEVRQYLRTVPAVSSATDEHEQQGGAGITVVTFDQ